MDIALYFPIWNKLTADRQGRVKSVSDFRAVSGGTLLHDGSPDCLGVILGKAASCGP